MDHRYKIYFNPRCRKCRETDALLEENGVEAEKVLYLEEAPTEEEIREICDLLSVNPIEITRTKEAKFKELGLSKESSDEELITAIAENPILLERPIVIKDGSEAAVGRPPENVKELL